MTAMLQRDPMVDELAAVRAQIANLEKRQVTHRSVEVTAADSGSATFTAVTPDGQTLTPLDAPSQFLPEAGQQVTLRMEGATPIYDPRGIAISAVGDREVSSISADFIGAGLLTGEVALANRITTALDGARVELNPLGLQKWNSSEELMISFTGDDNLLTGILKTAVSGRRVEVGASGNSGKVEMYSGSNVLVGLLESATEGGTEVIRLVVPTSGAWDGWNGVQFQSNNTGYITAGSMTVTVLDSGSFKLAVASNDGSAGTQPSRTDAYTVSASTHRFFVGSVAAEGSIDIVQHGVADSRNRSPRHQYRCEGGTQAMNVKAVIESGGTGLRLEVTDTSDSYGEIRASAFTVSSSAEGKENFGELSRSPLEVLSDMQLRTYERIGGDGNTEIGLIAEEAPAEVAVGNGDAISLYPLVVLNAGAIQELNARLTALEERAA